jgi:hypothetical protein
LMGDPRARRSGYRARDIGHIGEVTEVSEGVIDTSHSILQ